MGGTLFYHLRIDQPPMNASEPLPHFVDDLLGYLYAAHPALPISTAFHARRPAREPHRQGIESDTLALSVICAGSKHKTH